MKELSDSELLQEIKVRIENNRKTIREFDELMEQLWLTNKKLEESEAVKSHFISNVTNEIVNPFTSILGLANSIMNSTPKDFNKVKSMASLIYSEAFNLDFQLNNIFMAAKLEAGENNVEVLNTDIKNLVFLVIDTYKSEIDKKEIKLDTQFKGDFDNPFKTDPAKLRIIIINLLSNAIKFSEKKGEIKINCTIHNGVFSLSIRNFGTYISESNMSFVFDRFKRIDETINDKNKGHGLGLSVVQSLLNLLNGKIELKSNNKTGTNFEITVPESASEAETGEFFENTDFLFND